MRFSNGYTSGMVRSWAHLRLMHLCGYRSLMMVATARRWVINPSTHIVSSILGPQSTRHTPHGCTFNGKGWIESEEQQGKPRVDIEAKDAEAQAHEDWSNDE